MYMDTCASKVSAKALYLHRKISVEKAVVFKNFFVTEKYFARYFTGSKNWHHRYKKLNRYTSFDSNFLQLTVSKYLHSNKTAVCEF